jgi:hypothetical protein
MNMRFGVPPLAGGIRLVLGFALAAAALVTTPRLAHATKAEKVTLEEDSGPSPKPAEDAPASEPEEPPKVKRVVPPYSLPWQLRPVLPTTMLRSDTSFAFHGVDGSTIVSGIYGSYKFMPHLGAFAKIAVAESNPPTGTNPGGFGFANPLLGANVGLWPAKGIKLGLSLGLTLPVGTGGSNSTDRGAQFTNLYAMFARSGFDNALFMPDYFSILPGVDVAWVTKNFTLQGELNIVFLTKVRGIQQLKSANQDFSMGLHAGYFFFPWLSAGLDFRWQNWLSIPRHVQNDPSRDSRNNLTLGLGPRFHMKLSDTLRFRPGLSMSFGLDQPMAGSHYKILQLDLPFTF